jgi:hypothetical protein
MYAPHGAFDLDIDAVLGAPVRRRLGQRGTATGRRSCAEIDRDPRLARQEKRQVSEHRVVRGIASALAPAWWSRLLDQAPRPGHGRQRGRQRGTARRYAS